MSSFSSVPPVVVLVIPAASIGLLSWFSTLFILNRYKTLSGFSKVEILAVLPFLLTGFGGWVAELCILKEELFGLQVVASLYRTTMAWLGMLMIVNGRFLVTSQQLFALILSITTNLLWEWQHRIVLTP